MPGPYAFELHLIAADAPEGQIALADLGRIATALHELAIRIGRSRVAQTGTGRSFAAVESAAQLRLTGITEGSTTLELEQGAPDVLAIDLDLERDTFSSLLNMMQGVSVDRAPAWATPQMKESVLALVDALGGAAPEVQVRTGVQATIVIRPRTVRREVWTVHERLTDAPAELVGRVEAVDLRTGRFRLRDAVGNTVALHHVLDAERVASLVAQQAVAVGSAILGDRGQIVGLDRAELAPAASLPLTWHAPVLADHDALLASAEGPDPDGGLELTDDEFAAFLEAADH